MLELELIDCGCEELVVEENEIIVYGPFDCFGKLQAYFEQNNFEIIESGFDRIPTMSKKLSAEEEAEEVQEILSDIVEFFDILAEDDDEDYDEDDDDLYEVICPECGETYLTDFESFEEDDVSCPACGAPFKLEESVLEKLTHDDVDASDKDK